MHDHNINFDSTISIDGFCRLREAVGFQKLPNDKYGYGMLVEL